MTGRPKAKLKTKAKVKTKRPAAARPKPKAAAKRAAPRHAALPRRPVTTPGEILRPFPPSVRRLANELRKLIRRTLPRVEEKAYAGWHGIGYHDRQAGYLAGIFPQADCIKLYFEHGSVLPDPHHVLTGTGSQVRHVSCWPDVPVPERAIRELLAAAIRFGAVR